MDVYFYHLERKTLEEVLPELLERTLAKGWRALVRVGSDERAGSLDSHLWTYREDSFLPHGLDGDPMPVAQPILISQSAANANAAQALFLVDGVGVGDWAALPAAGFERVAVVFDGRDEAALTRARAQWKAVKEAGFNALYWQQTLIGKWEKKA